MVDFKEFSGSIGPLARRASEGRFAASRGATRVSRLFLVTGGAGFIGSHIVEALVARGDRVRVLDNLCTGKRANLAPFGDRVEFIEGDLVDRRRRCRPRCGRRLRLPPSGAGLGAAERREAARHARRLRDRHGERARRGPPRRRAARGLRRLSSSAYGNQPTSSKRETDLPAPISPYGAAKLAGEIYCQSFAATYGLETVCLRYFNVFGPRQDPDSPYSAVIPLFITALLAGRRPVVYGDGRQSRDFTYVENVVRGNLLAADAPNVGGPGLQRRQRPADRACWS